jgi:tetratricopeptide (TPR) repeat protein
MPVTRAAASAPLAPGERGTYWRLKLHALTLLILGRRQRAHAIFGDMLGRWPADAYALASRAHLSAQLGHHDEALADAQALVKAHPQRAAADWFNLAYLLDEAGQQTQAEPAFRRALEMDPALDRAWYGLGLTLIHLQRPDDAIEAFKRNTELQPMSPYGWYQLARIHADRQQPDEARRIIAHLKTFEPKVAAQLTRETGLAV